MNKTFKKIYSFFVRIAIRWWCFWSNIRFRKCVREDINIYERDFILSLEDVKKVSNMIYRKFKYKNDGADQLWDAIVPPPQNYLNYTNGKIEDDCDGFHSAIYHCIHKTYECYLLSVVGPGTGHCLLIFKSNDLWHVLDYTRLYGGKIRLEDAISEYFKDYKNIYGKEVCCFSLVKYDYDKRKFYRVKMSEVISLYE